MFAEDNCSEHDTTTNSRNANINIIIVVLYFLSVNSSNELMFTISVTGVKLSVLYCTVLIINVKVFRANQSK